MASYTTYLNGYSNRDHKAPPIVQPGQTLPRIDTSRLVTPIVVREESDVTVSVHVTGRPPPKVTWYIGETTLSPSVEYQMKQKGNVHYLTILNVSEEVEEGLYVAASNVVGRVKKKIDVKLYRVLSKHKPRHRRTWHSHKYTGVVRRQKNPDAPQRFKSFGSFGQFDTLIDGDPDDEVLEDLDEKLYASLCRYKSTPNIQKIPCTENPISAQQRRDVYHERSNYTTRCQTLPSLLNSLTDGRTRQLTKSTEAIHNELTVKSIPAFEMDFGGFPSQPSSAHIPQPPVKEEGNTSLTDSDFYTQYNRNAQRSVSTFLPQESTEEIQGERRDAVSSFRGDSPRYGALAQGGVGDQHPEQAQDPYGEQGQDSFDSIARQFSANTSSSSWKPASYLLDHDENVLAGNLKKTSVQGKLQGYPKIAPKPKVKKSKKTKDGIASERSDATGADQRLHTYENLASLQIGDDNSQSASNHVEEGFYPDQSSSAILYAPDGTMFKLPMTGEYDPNLVLGARHEQENTTSVSEQHSFAILPNESINLSHGEQTSPLSVFQEDRVRDRQTDKPTKVKSKPGKKVKKKSKSAEDNVDVSVAKAQSTPVQQEYNASFSRSSHQNTALPALPRGQQSENVYENIAMVTSDHQSTNSDVLQEDNQLDISGHYYSANSSFDTNYPKAGISLYDFQPDQHSSSIASGASVQSVPITPTSPGTSSIHTKTAEFSTNYYQPVAGMDQAAHQVSNVSAQHPSASIGEAAAAAAAGGPGGASYGSGHRVGGRRPAQPPPPPPSTGLTPQSPEMYPSSPTKPSQYNQQLISQPASSQPVYTSDLDTAIPMSTDDTAPSQQASLHLDYSVPMEASDPVPKTKVRKSPHRKGDSSLQSSDGSSLPKKPKVAKKPKQFQQKSLNSDYCGASLDLQQQQQQQQQQLAPTQDYYLPQQPKETNIDDIVQRPSAGIQQETDISYHVKKVRRSKLRSRSRDAPEPNVAMEEVWIDKAPNLAAATDVHMEQHQPDVPHVPFSSSDIANASTPKMLKKKMSHSVSEHSPGIASGQLEAVEIDINNPASATLPSGIGVYETNIDAAAAEPVVTVLEQQLPSGEYKKVKKVVKKKKKITKSVGDVSSVVDTSLQPSNPEFHEIDINGRRMTPGSLAEDEMVKKKVVKKKKKMNKSTGDINADLMKEMVDIDIQMADKPKKKVKKKVTKSVGDLSQALTSDGKLVDVQDGSQLDSFTETQTLEWPKKKVKKVKKKTKSVGDLTSGEAMGFSLVNIDIDDNQKELGKDDQLLGEKKKKKKKSLKSLSTEGAVVSQEAPTDVALVQTIENQQPVVNVARETCIDDMIPGKPEQPQMAFNISRETCIDDVLPQATKVQQTIQGVSHETCIDDVLPQSGEVLQQTVQNVSRETCIDDIIPYEGGQVMGVVRETCIDDVLPQQADKGSLPRETCIDDVTGQVTEKERSQRDYVRSGLKDAESVHVYASVDSKKEKLYENVSQLSDDVNRARKLNVGDPQNVKYQVGVEEMDVLPDTQAEQNVLESFQSRKVETNIDVDFYDPLPVSSQQDGRDLLLPVKSLEQSTEMEQLPDQQLLDRETTIDDVFDGTQITSSPQEPKMDLPPSESLSEMPKKVKKKRSKSTERGKLLQEDGVVLEGQLSVDGEKRLKKKKKKMNKSTGDLTDVGHVLVDIDIDTPSKTAEIDEISGQQQMEGDAATRKVKKVKKKSVSSLKSEGMDDVEQKDGNVIVTGDGEKKKKKKVVKKKLHKSTGDLHMTSAPLVSGQEINIDDTSMTPAAEGMAADGTQQTEKKKKKVVKKKVIKDACLVQDTATVHDTAIVHDTALIPDTAVIPDTAAVQDTNVDDLLINGIDKVSDGVSRMDDQGMIQYRRDEASVQEEVIPEPPRLHDDDVIMSSPHLDDAAAGVQQTVKTQAKKIKKAKIKSTSDLVDLSGMQQAGRQDTDVDGTNVHIQMSQESVDTSQLDSAVKKKKKVVKKKINKSLSDLSQSGSVNVVEMEVDLAQDTSAAPHLISLEGSTGVPVADTGEKKKKKVVKKKKINKSLSDLSQLQSTTLIDFQKGDDQVFTQEMNGDLTTGTPVQEPGDGVLIDTGEKKKKKVVKKKKINKSLSDLSQSSTLIDFSPGESVFAQESKVNYEGVTMEPGQEPVDIGSTDTGEKKKKKVVKKKKVNKSLSDLSQLQSSTLIDFSSDEKVVSQECKHNGEVITMTSEQELVLDTGEKKKKSKSVADLSEPLSTDMQLVKDVEITEPMDNSINGSIPISADVTQEVTPKEIKIEKEQKTVEDQSDVAATVVYLDKRDVQPMNTEFVSQKEAEDDGMQLDASMTSATSQQPRQEVDDMNTEPLPSETNVDDIFLDQETMKTVLGDVLVTSAYSKDASQESVSMIHDREAIDQSQSPRDAYDVKVTDQSYDSIHTPPGDSDQKTRPSDDGIQTTAMQINQTPEITELVQSNKKKAKKLNSVTKSASDSSAASTGNVPDSGVTGKEGKKRKKKVRRPLDEGADDAGEQTPMAMDFSDIPLIDSDLSEDVSEERLNLLNTSQKSRTQSDSSASQRLLPDTSTESISDRDVSLRREKDIYDVITRRSVDIPDEKASKTTDVAAVEMNNNTPEADNEVLPAPKDDLENTTQMVDTDQGIKSEIKPDKTTFDHHSISLNLFPKKSFSDFEQPESLSIFNSYGKRQTPSEADETTKTLAAGPGSNKVVQPEPLPVKVHRKKDYPPVKYRPWTDILFGSSADTKIKVTKKESSSTERSLNSSFADSSFDSQTEKRDEEKASYPKIMPYGIPSEAKRKPTDSSQTDKGRSDRGTGELVLERKPSLRKQTKSLENLVDAEVDDVRAVGLTTYNKYDDDEDDDDDDLRGKRIRTKSVDNLTLLQQRQRQASADRKMESKREHSKSTGCLLEGRIAKLARKTLTRELLYETVTTVEEVVVIKHPRDKAKMEVAARNTDEAKENVNKKERRYLGSLVIVDIYDDKDAGEPPVFADADDSADSSFVTDTAAIKESVSAIVSDYRRSSGASSRSENLLDSSKPDDDVSSVHSSSYVSTETRTSSDYVIKERSSTDSSTQVIETVVTTTLEDVGVQKEEPAVVTLQAKELPVDVSPVRLQVVGPCSADEVKPALQMESPVVVITEKCILKTDTTTAKQSLETSKDEGTQVDLGDLQPRAVPHRASPELGPQIVDDSSEDDTSEGSATETDGESGESYDAEDADWNQEERQEVDASLESHYLDAIVEEDQDSEREAKDSGEVAENIHTTTITITDEITTIKSSAAENSGTVCVGDQLVVDGDNLPASNTRTDSLHILNISLQSETDSTVRRSSPDQSETESNVRRSAPDQNSSLQYEMESTIGRSAPDQNISLQSETDSTVRRSAPDQNISIQYETESTTGRSAPDQNIRLQSETVSTVRRSAPDQNISIQSETVNTVPRSAPDRSTVIRSTERVTMVSHGEKDDRRTSLSSGDEESSEEDVDVILPPRDACLKETWEEVVTYEYEFDKETGVKKIILKPKVTETKQHEYFAPVVRDAESTPSRRRTPRADADVDEPESVVVYEYGEMISMYSDTSVSDIYLNNSLELGTSGTEGAYAGVERAIEIMVSQQIRNAICEVTGQPVSEQSSQLVAANPPSPDTGTDNQEPLPPSYLASAAVMPTDIEIDISQMTPNLKKAVEMLRTKYNIVKMSREATPVPQELGDDSGLAEATVVNNEPLPLTSEGYVDEQVMEEVQEELETVMIELNKMDLTRAMPIGSRIQRPNDRSGSESSDTDTLVETDAQETGKRADDDGKGDHNDDTEDDDDDDDDDDSGENMIFDMDDVFVKVVTTKDGRIKKIKILEGKEGGDTKKIVSPDDVDDQLTEQTRTSDQRYFTKKFYEEEFLAEEEQSESGSADSDAVERQQPGERARDGTELDGDAENVEGRRYDQSSSGGHPEMTSHPDDDYYQDYDDRRLPDDHSTDSETSEDDDDDGDDDDDDNDDDEFFEEDDERESPMRSLSPIAEEADVHDVMEPSSPHPAKAITDSSEEEEEEEAIEDVEAARAEVSLSPRLLKQLSESQEDLEILRELVRAEETSPSEESDRNSGRLSPSIEPHADHSNAAIHQQLTSPMTARGATEQISRQTTETSVRLATSGTSSPDTSSSDPDVDSESDIITQKLQLEGFLSSLDKESSSSC